jgi:hypothetical protein
MYFFHFYTSYFYSVINYINFLFLSIYFELLMFYPPIEWTTILLRVRVFRKCIKGDWWAFWEGTKTVPCVKIKGHGYTDYGPNFCYEKKWDSASVAEVGIFAGEVVAGAVAGFFSGGAAALPAYCATSVGVSAVGAWALAGTMAEDKWPSGINQ